MQEIGRIGINWASSKSCHEHPLAGNILQLRTSLEKLASSGNEKAQAHLNAENSCQYVYWGCGSCPDGGARVDAYCGEGGADPDFSWCETC